MILMPPPTSKPNLRSTIKHTLDTMSILDRSSQSQQLCTQITTSDLYQSASTILCYASLPTELSLDPLITQALAEHKTVCIPSVDWETKTMQPVQIESLDNNLQIGRYGLRSPSPDCKPIPDAQITLALIPGLGFDPAGHRLGRGAGFYDRWIEQRRQLDTPVSLVGVCFDEQLVERIPTDPHDQPMDRVVTPTAEYVRTHG
tara:strand:- start:25523 stop:26128 length:606 start_codon:yes stop_codon:yes gene_type:complete